MAIDGELLPVRVHESRSLYPSSLVAGRGVVRCGAELVELSERFQRGIFIGGTAFIGMAGAGALALLPLRDSTSSYASPTVLLTVLLIAVTPIAVWRAGSLYRLLRRRPEAQLALVLMAAALVAYPLRSELWWPSCALLMLLATVVSLRRTLACCLAVLLVNLAAHGVAGDLDETPPVTIIGLWIGYVFWCSAFSVFTDRLAAYVLRLNTTTTPTRLPPLRVFVSPSPAREEPSVSNPDGEPATSAGVSAVQQLSARQLQVLALLADGLRYDEVAACLDISGRQVQRHVSNAIARLGLRNANQLLAVVVAEGLVPTAVS